MMVMPSASVFCSAAATRMARALVRVGAATLASTSGLMRNGMSNSRPPEVCWAVTLEVSTTMLSALMLKALKRLAMPALKSSSMSAKAGELTSVVTPGRVTSTRTVAVVAQVSELPAHTPHSSTPFQQQSFWASRVAGPQQDSPAREMGQVCSLSVSEPPDVSGLIGPGLDPLWKPPLLPGSVETSTMVIVPRPEKAGKAREGLLASTSMNSCAPDGSSTKVTTLGTATEAGTTFWMVTAGLEVMPRSLMAESTAAT
mmetsp:Transcript_31009/g.87830  ORF Transcript_31009/g.87830 Transcript_31009/m.87830 type:complete len:257 (+) Transcript_31009:779-1549(+)